VTMSERVEPNFETFEIPFTELDSEYYKPQGGWKPDKLYPNDDFEVSRDNYVDIHDLIEVCDLPDWIPQDTFAVNALGWMVSKRAPSEESGPKSWRRLRGRVEGEVECRKYLNIHLSKSIRGSTKKLGVITHKVVLAAFGRYDSSRVDYNPVNARSCPHHIHHIDHDKRNNHILNLVQVAPVMNCRYQQVREHQGHSRRNNHTGETGISKIKGMWYCRMMIRGEERRKSFPMKQERYRWMYDPGRNPDEIPDPVLRVIRRWRREKLGVDEMSSQGSNSEDDVEADDRSNTEDDDEADDDDKHNEEDDEDDNDEQGPDNDLGIGTLVYKKGDDSVILRGMIVDYDPRTSKYRVGFHRETLDYTSTEIKDAGNGLVYSNIGDNPLNRDRRLVIGRVVQKDFGQNGVFKGRVIDRKEDPVRLWTVLYTDGDKENLSKDELKEVLVEDLGHWMGNGEGWGEGYEQWNRRRIQRHARQLRRELRDSRDSVGDGVISRELRDSRDSVSDGVISPHPSLSLSEIELCPSEIDAELPGSQGVSEGEGVISRPPSPSVCEIEFRLSEIDAELGELGIVLDEDGIELLEDVAEPDDPRDGVLVESFRRSSLDQTIQQWKKDLECESEGGETDKDEDQGEFLGEDLYQGDYGMYSGIEQGRKRRRKRREKKTYLEKFADREIRRKEESWMEPQSVPVTPKKLFKSPEQQIKKKKKLFRRPDQVQPKNKNKKKRREESSPSPPRKDPKSDIQGKLLDIQARMLDVQHRMLDAQANILW